MVLVRLKKELKIDGMGHKSDEAFGGFYSLLLPGPTGMGRFDITEEDLTRFSLKPGDFLKKYFKLCLDLEASSEGELQPFELRKLENARPSYSEFAPTEINLSYSLELRKMKIVSAAQIASKPESDIWLFLRLTQAEYEAARLLQPATHFKLNDYAIKEREHGIVQYSNEIIFDELLRSKKHKKHIGEYVAIMNGKLVGFDRDPITAENVANLKEGELYVRKFIEDTRRPRYIL